MKVEFEGDFDEIMTDIASMLNRLGLMVVPHYEEIDDAEDEPAPSSVAAAYQEPAPATETAPKKRGRPRKEEPLPQPEEDGPMEDEDMDIPSTESSGSLDAIGLQKLKEDTLKRLRDLYVAGKGPFVRELLAKHGHGALVFPEVAAVHFPAIKADMEREMH